MPSAVTMDTSEASMPTDRSMPPEIMTSVMPTAMIPATPTCWRMFSRLTGLMNVGNRLPRVRMSCSATMMTMKPRKMDRTVKFSHLLNGEIRTALGPFATGSVLILPCLLWNG